MKRLQDIADQVGVSRTTVSNVLHGNTKKVSKEMIRKISEILNQEGYVPNTSSRELTRKGSCIIGLVLGYNCVHGIPSLRDTFVAELLSGVEETAHRNGYYIMLINGQDKNTDQVAEIASRWNVDGLVVLGLDEKKYKELRRQLNKYMVLIDTYPEAEYHYVNVGTDDFGGGNSTVGMAFSGNDIADAMCIANAMGGYIDRWIENPDGTMSWSTLAPEVKAAWAKMNEWYEEGILDPQFGTRTTEDINAMMINNELGIVFGAWHIPDWRLSSVKALVPEAEYIAYTVADDNGIVHTYHENAADRFLVVSKDCKYPQVAVEILNILYDDLARATAETAPDVIAYINAGGHNEGRPYYMEVLPSNNPSIYYTEHMAVINGEMTPEETTIAENRGSSQAILDYLKDPQNVTEKTLGGWHFYESRIIGLGASIEALEKNGNAEWITPKYPPTTPTSEQKKATLDKTELEAYVAIVTGAQPIDYFDTFVSEWKRLGGDAIAQEVQEYFAQ